MRLRSDAALLRSWVSGWGGEGGGCWRLEGADANSVAGDDNDDATQLTANAFARLTPASELMMLRAAQLGTERSRNGVAS